MLVSPKSIYDPTLTCLLFGLAVRALFLYRPSRAGNENAWKEFEDGKVNLVTLLDQADEKLRNIRKQFDPKAGAEDVAMRLEIAAKTREANEACLKKLMGNVEIICNICSADKKEEVLKTVSRPFIL